jgi:hypothetical protein
MLESKKAKRMGNGMILIYSVHALGGGIQRYKTRFGAERSAHRLGRIGYRVNIWETWQCERCGHMVNSPKWAAKHTCK